MKKSIQKSLALLLAVLMTLSALGVSAAAADDYKLIAIGISTGTAGKEITMEGNSTKTLGVMGTFQHRAYATIETRNLAASDVHWSSSNTDVLTVSSEGVLTAKAVKVATKVTVSAFVLYKDEFATESTPFTDEITVNVTPEVIKVEKINWSMKNSVGGEKNAFVVGEVYSFAGTYSFEPDDVADETVTVTCSHKSAMQIDNEAKTIKANSLPDGKDRLTVTLTMTANGASASCQPATKQVTIVKDIPLKEVKWTYSLGSTGKTQFFYWNQNSNKTQKAYHDFKYQLIAQDGSVLDASAAGLCKIEIKSSDPRVVRVDVDKDGKPVQFIAVGNGEAQLTIRATTPKGYTCYDVVTVQVKDSPYTPISSIQIKSLKEGSDQSAYAKNDTVYLMFGTKAHFTGALNEGAKLDQKKIDIILNRNGEELRIVDPIVYSWESSDNDVVKVSVDKDGTVYTEAVGVGNATLTLKVNDNGKEYTESIKVKGYMTWWEALMGLFFSIISFNFAKVPVMFKALIGSFGV